jgi:hypothetical protein
MIRKPPKGPIAGRPSEKARGTLHKRSRALSLAAKLRLRKKLSKKVVPDAADGWSATRVKDEQTDLVSFITCGPTRGGDTFKVSIPAEQREEQKRVRKTLRSYDAALPGQVDDDLEFLDALFDGAKISPLIATSKPGFTDTGKGFVLGAQMLGDAVERYLWLGEEYSTLGQTSGTREGWNEEVGKLLQHSSFATIAVCTVLASPVPAYVQLHKSEDPHWRPALSETSINNFGGESASGKTLATGTAASLSGDPSDRAKWEFSRRGLEEYDRRLHCEGELRLLPNLRRKRQGTNLRQDSVRDIELMLGLNRTIFCLLFAISFGANFANAAEPVLLSAPAKVMDQDRALVLVHGLLGRLAMHTTVPQLIRAGNNL